MVLLYCHVITLLMEKASLAVICSLFGHLASHPKSLISDS